MRVFLPGIELEKLIDAIRGKRNEARDHWLLLLDAPARPPGGGTPQP